MLSFVKERKGDKMAEIGSRDTAWNDLEKVWQALSNVKGFSAPRAAKAMYLKHYMLRMKRAKQPITTPQPSTTSTTAQTPSVSIYGRKRTAVEKPTAAPSPQSVLEKLLEKLPVASPPGAVVTVLKVTEMPTDDW